MKDAARAKDSTSILCYTPPTVSGYTRKFGDTTCSYSMWHTEVLQQARSCVQLGGQPILNKENGVWDVEDNPL